MKQLLSLALISLSFITNAQTNWSVGLRTGMEIIKTTTLNEDDTQPLLQQQIFLSKRIFKQFEVELNATYKSPIKSTSLATPGQINDGPDYWMESSTINILEFGIFARYFLVQKKNWAPYVMAGLNATNWVNNSKGYTSAYTGWGGSYPAQYYHNKYTELIILNQIAFGLGVNKTISNHWKLNVQTTVNYDLPASISSNSFWMPSRLNFNLVQPIVGNSSTWNLNN